MILADLKFLKDDLLKNKEKNTALLIKSFYSEPPSWEELLKCISKEASEDGSIVQEAMSKGSGESLIGTVVYKQLYFNVNFSTKKLEEYFPDIYNILMEIWNNTKLRFNLSGLKIALSKYDVVPHTDRWDAIALQVQGTSYWKIKSQDGLYQEEFILEPGDFLFCPMECTHEIKSLEPRSTFIFNLNNWNRE